MMSVSGSRFAGLLGVPLSVLGPNGGLEVGRKFV